MKIFFKLLLFSLLLSCSTDNLKISDASLVKSLDSLRANDDYFNLKRLYHKGSNNLSTIDSLYFKAIIDNVFNNAEESNKSIEILIKNYGKEISDSINKVIYQKKLLNHLNLYEYAMAANTSQILQHDYSNLIDSLELENLQNEFKIWNALKEVPKQELIKFDDATIPMYRDKVGLYNIDVTFGENTKNLLFDTGANFSVIVRSLANGLGYNIMSADFYVTAATGKKVKADIAIADQINISGILVKNVFFLVLDDHDLSFPQIDYYVNGAIGFPVIEAMEELRISKDDEIFVPLNPIKYDYNNLALYGLMPILAVDYRGDELRFNFDTGAAKTSLFSEFFKKYHTEIENKYQKTNLSSSSGGGTVEFEGYLLDDLKFTVADKSAVLSKVQLHLNEISKTDGNFHGNFGQDYIKQFQRMIISFKYTSVLFE